MVIVMALSVLGFASYKIEAKTKLFETTITPKLNSIKIKWNKKKGATKYAIYRYKTNKPDSFDSDNPPKPNKYKKIKTVKKKSFVDKKIKLKKYYSYYVVALKKGKKIASTYDTDYLCLCCKGLEQPVLRNGGRGDDEYNSTTKLYMYGTVDGLGYCPSKTKLIIYRKVEGEKKYKKIIPKTNLQKTVLDKKVKPGKTHYYKAKLFLKKGKKKYYSQYSDVLEMPAVNRKAKYRIETLTKSGIYPGKSMTAIFKLSNAIKYNGVTDLGNRARYRVTGKEGEFKYDMFLKKYSYDNKKWMNIPSHMLTIPATGAIYLQFELKTMNDKENRIIFGGDDKDNYFESDIQVIQIDDENGESWYDFITYHSSIGGDTFGALDLLTKSGYAYEDWD